MPGLVGGLHGEELLDLAEVRVHAGEQAGGDDERGLLVLHEVGHDLHDGGLDVRRHRLVRGRGPVDRGGRVPLGGGGVGVEPRREVGPHDVAVVEVEATLRAARLDQRTARGEAPPRRRPRDDPVHARTAGPFGARPAVGVGRAADELPGGGAVGPHREAVALPPGPGPQVHAEGRVPAGDADASADREIAQGAADEEVGAPLEPEEAQVEHGVERGAAPCHGVYSAAVTAPPAS